MPITIEHGIGPAGGMAAYAAGRGKAEERKRKYATDALRDQQRQFQGFKYQAALQGMRQMADQQMALQNRGWEIENLQQRRNWAVEDRALEEKFRAGEAEKSRWFEAGEAEKQRQWRGYNAEAAALPAIPDYVPIDVRRGLAQQRDTLQNMMLSPHVDRNDPKIEREIRDRMQRYQEAILAVPKPDIAEQAGRQIFTDRKTGKEMWWSGDPKDKPEPMVEDTGAADAKKQFEHDRTQRESMVDKAAQQYYNAAVNAARDAGEDPASVSYANAVERARKEFPEPSLPEVQAPAGEALGATEAGVKAAGLPSTKNLERQNQDREAAAQPGSDTKRPVPLRDPAFRERAITQFPQLKNVYEAADNGDLNAIRALQAKGLY